jgi:hypothetical protein
MKFLETGCVVGEIAEAKSRDNQVERLGTQRKMERIGLDGDRVRLCR